MDEPWSDGAGPLFLEKKNQIRMEHICTPYWIVLLIPCPVAFPPCCLTTGRGQHCNFREDQSQPISPVGSRLLQRPGSHPLACPMYINIYTSIRYMILHGVHRTPPPTHMNFEKYPPLQSASRKAKRRWRWRWHHVWTTLHKNVMMSASCILCRKAACLSELLTQLPLLESIR